jgi:hypothetical protein
VDAQVVHLTMSLEAISKQVNRVVVGVGLSALGTPPRVAASPNPLAPHNARSTSREQGSGQTSHGDELTTGGATVEHSLASLSTPITGTEIASKSLALINVPTTQQSAVVPHTMPPPPPTDFPRFEGENPRMWQRAAEKYFRLFSMDDRHRVEYATMHFTGEAAMWLNSIENQLDQLTWEQLCDKLGRQFDRGQYQMLYRQVFKLQQTGTVVEYIEKFNTL